LKQLFICLILTGLLVAKLNIIDTHDAWLSYPSLDVSGEIYNVDISLSKLNYYNKDIDLIKQDKLDYLNKISKTMLSNNSYDDYINVGIIYAQNMFYKIALDYFNKSLKLKETSRVYNNIANIYYILMNDVLAIKYYKLALKKSKNNPETLLNLAFISYDSGDFKNAKKYYLTAIIIDPTIDSPEYKILAGDVDNVKASNKGVKKFLMKWSK
jgi:tetratricopeptide (TPR) repeat protein